MAGIYVLLICLGGWFLVDSLSGAHVAYKTLVQSVIMLAIGIGGVVISLKHRAALAAETRT
jgi:hypothetical protein